MVEIIVPVVAISVIFGTPIAIVIAAIVSNYKKNRKKYEAMVRAIELGKDPDEIKELFAVDEQKKKKNGKGLLKGGVVVSGIGFGLIGMALVLAEIDMYGPGVFMLILGLALIVAYLLTKPKVPQVEDK